MTLHDLAAAVERAQIVCTQQKVDPKTIKVVIIKTIDNPEELVVPVATEIYCAAERFVIDTRPYITNATESK